ncbi:MAG TPA: sialidase family protein, partial [Ktedonobacteraceae bacterium]|nr:sialidase family protein [Ktedonobacteraceae bacterium]
AFNDTHRVVEYARITTDPASGALYLTFNALGASPQSPNSALAATWTSQLYFASSLNGGQAWSAPVAIGTGQQDYWGIPVVDWNGAILVFYSGALGLELVQSSNGGQAWSSPRSLDPVNAVGEQRAYNEVYLNPGPGVAVDLSNKMLYVVYNGGQIILSSDDGTTWSQPIDVLGNRYSPAFLASISVDPVSHIVSVGGYSSAGDPSQNTFAYYYAQSEDGGNHFSSPALVSDNASLPPPPAFGSIGRASSVVSGGQFARLFWTDTNGVNGNEQILTASVDLSQPLMGALQNSWDSAQLLPPWGVVFGGAGSQAIGVGDYGQGSIGAVSATPCAACSWLSASVSAGTAVGSWVVTVSTSSAATSQVGSVTIQATGLNSSITIPVQLQIDLATPAFSLGTNALTFTTLQGIDPPTQAVQVDTLRSINEQLQVYTNGDPVLSASFANGSPNIVLSPGVSNGLIVLVSVAGLPVGSSTHTLVVSDGTTSLDVTLTLTIDAAPAQLNAPASSLNFAYHQQSALRPASQSIILRNSGGSALHWQGSTDVSWLSLGTTNGTIAPGALQQVMVNVTTAELSQGTSIGHIVLGGDAQAVELPQIIPVYLVIDPPANQISKTWYFAEGYVSANFAEYLTLENPNAQPASVAVTYLTQPINQAPKAPFTLTYQVNPGSRFTVSINSQPGIVQNDQVSLVVNASVPIVAERPMYFKYTVLNPNPTGGTDIVGATHLNSVFFFPFVQIGSDAQSGSTTFGTTYSTYLTVLN